MFNDFFIHAGEVWVFVKYPCILPEYGYVDSRTPIRMTKNNFEMLEIIVDPIPVGELYRLDLNSYYHKTALIDMEITEKLEVLPEEGKGDKPNNSGECNCEPIDLSNLATKEELNIKADKTEVPSIDGLASEEYVQQKITEALANFSPRKLFDIIAATELPEDGRENQICVITDNPVDKFRISDNLDDNSFSEDEIFIYLDRRWKPQSKSILLKNDNIENHINIVDCRQGNIKKLDSYIYQNNQWNKLTDKTIVVLYKDYFNKELFGSFPDKDINKVKDWILDENGIFFSESATGPDCTPKVALFFKNKIDFSLFNKVRITIQLSRTSSYRLIIGSGTHSKYVGPGDYSDSLEWSCYGNNNSSTYANTPFKNVAYSVVKHSTKDEVRTHEIDISTLNDFDYIGIALSSHGVNGYIIADMRIIEIELL